MEQVYYEEADAKVTSSRFIVGNQTYVMRNVTSVTVGVKKPRRFWLVVALIFGAIVTFQGIGEIQMGHPGNLIIGLAIIGLTIFWLRWSKATYNVMLTTSAGEVKALGSTNRSIVERVVQALNEAIVSRG